MNTGSLFLLFILSLHVHTKTRGVSSVGGKPAGLIHLHASHTYPTVLAAANNLKRTPWVGQRGASEETRPWGLSKQPRSCHRPPSSVCAGWPPWRASSLSLSGGQDTGRATRPWPLESAQKGRWIGSSKTAPQDAHFWGWTTSSYSKTARFGGCDPHCGTRDSPFLLRTLLIWAVAQGIWPHTLNGSCAYSKASSIRPACTDSKSHETQDISPSHVYIHVCTYVYTCAYVCMYVVYESKGGEKQERQALLDFSLLKKECSKGEKNSKKAKSTWVECSIWVSEPGLWKVGSDQKAVSPGAELAQAPQALCGPPQLEHCEALTPPRSKQEGTFSSSPLAELF